MTEESLWAEYKAFGGQDLRNELLLHYLPVAKQVAGRVGATLPNSVSIDDLISFGTFGLMDAIEKFDPERGTKFETYAATRIRGAILDELRASDWVPRSVRAKTKALSRAKLKLENQLGRNPTRDEICIELEWTMDFLLSTEKLLRSLDLVSLEEKSTGTMDTTLGDTIEADDKGAPDSYAEMAITLCAEITGLSQRERIVLTLYYFEGLTLSDIGTCLGVTESRVCQIHTKAMTSLNEACDQFR